KYDEFIKKDRKFKQLLDKKVGVSTVNEFVNARSKEIKAIKVDKAISNVVISLTSIYKSKSEPLIDYLIAVKDRYEFEYD
ncbi:36166_t:CDS:1, partial [Racocetra persica]